jgi:hypothetical protein
LIGNLHLPTPKQNPALHASNNGKTHPWQSYRVQARYPVQLLSCLPMEEANYFYAGGQNFEPYPQKLLCRKNRLYVIDNHGKVDKKWKRGFGSAKKFPPYFVKITMPED